MKILFLDQSGKLGGAELSLLDIATAWRENCLVGLFADGAFRQALTDRQIPVEVFTQRSLSVSKNDGLTSAIASLGTLMPLVLRTVQRARQYDVIYANTQKAFVVGAIAALLSQRPLVYHLRDILSSAHFSQTNLRVAVTCANRAAALVIANSHATRDAFVAAGGNAALVRVVHNGFDAANYGPCPAAVDQLRQQLGLQDKFVVGHFSRLSPWKGQHVLLAALQDCPEDVVVVVVGDALFGETDYVQQLHQQVEDLGLADRVQFLGFRSDIPALMQACDLITHTSTAPEPFGRVIVEAMLCQRPVIAAAAGGAVELIQPGVTGWLTPPHDVAELAAAINHCCMATDTVPQVVAAAYHAAMERFSLDRVQSEIAALLANAGSGVGRSQPHSDSASR